jgi:hypothetical protein
MGRFSAIHGRNEIPHMDIQLSFWLESKYGNDLNDADRAWLIHKIAEYAQHLMKENNHTRRHLGLHCIITDYQVLIDGNPVA